MEPRRIIFLLVFTAAVPAIFCRAQPSRRGGGSWEDVGEGGGLVRGEGGILIDENSVRTARETASHSTGTPTWSNPAGFEKDVFTFARVMFKSDIATGS